MAEKHESAWAKSMTFKEQRTVIKRLLPYAAPYKWDFIWALVLAFLVSLINVGLPRLMQIYMDQYLRVHNAGLRIVLFFAGFYFLGTLIKAIFQFGQEFLYAMGGERMLENVRVRLFRKLHTLGMRYFDQVPAGSILSRLTNDTMSFQTFWSLFAAAIVALFSIITSFVAMYRTNAQVAWMVLAFLPILMFAIWYYQHFSSRVYRTMRERLSELNAKLAESINGISVIQEFRQEHRMNREFATTNDAYFETRQAMIHTNSLLLGPIINLLFALGEVGVLWLFGINAMNHFVLAGTIYAFIQYLNNFYNPMSNMMDSLSDFQDGVVAGSRVLRIMDDETYAPQQTPVDGAKITRGEIEFRHVNFSYDGKHDVLHDVSFTVKPGQTLALVGHTGSGKSSTINVLMRFYEFSSGEILIDGRDIREYDLAELRRHFGLVLQDSFMFYGDIASNIRMFDDSITDEQVEAAARFVSADHFIDQLPGKYHAKVLERGASYSGGQRQLLSFARTVAHNPKVLILDEATADIDTETEALIQDGLQKLRQGRTTIAIAHRLSTIRDADQILVLDQGRIVERGSHDELLAQRGRYYDMYRLQTAVDADKREALLKEESEV
ncbi:ABC transporter ATP-binding protein [Furfurilactobacillus siliginis]|uniref:ABC transporter ATP-binding protein n=1 Tax=Furfurilactobacillus siliginis TaxID=348151 RepID=A0A0R2L0S6_9LACO|nr:ABC transporter ATP-binding protein [Furfurilactobacillus siliginis]KRN95387.1 abc transporter, atp-binding and permease protein [Furfurilactobacillus siliginis]GEK28167.1 ABC transporter ATP-binding protein [Furfurilactobacillus siliginis]